MKSEIKVGPTGAKKWPRLMQAKSGIIVLMNEDMSGTVLYDNVEKCNYTGKYIIGWNIQNFVDFDGSITLSND